MKIPKVSVIMPTYNHAPFVDEAIRSVLTQEGVDLELLIGDDGSSDGTADVVRRHQDSRIRFTAHAVNQGACVVVNDLIRQARGEYVALLNSDDVWPTPRKLAEQVEILDGRPELGALFGRPEFMDRHGVSMPKENAAMGLLFDRENRSQAAWLRFFLESGNCMCHPTMMIRRRCYEELGAYNNRMRQLPDFDMWVRLVKRYPIYISDKIWVKFRVLPGENASSPTVANSVRGMNEYLLIAEDFLEDVSPSMLLEAFHDWLPMNATDDSVRLDIARVIPFLKTGAGPFKRIHRLIALMKLRHLLDSAAHREVLAAEYGLDDRRYHQLLVDEDCLSIDFDWNPTHTAIVQNRTAGGLNAQLQRIAMLEKEVRRPLLSLIARRIKKKRRGESLI